MKNINKILIIFIILLISLCFRKTRKYIFSNYITITKEIPNKCWLHRTNTVEKMLEISEKYKGIEIDVNFNNDKLYFDVTYDLDIDVNFNNDKLYFDVTYDLDKSIELSLEEYFKYFSKNDKKIWIDFKNLTERNVENSLNVFENLLRKYNVDRKRFIIESNNFEVLQFYKEKGYYTSYYVPYLDLENMTSEELEEWRLKIKNITLTNNVSAISFPGHMYSFIKSIDVDIDLLTWEAGEKWQMLYYRKITREMLKNNRV